MIGTEAEPLVGRGRPKQAEPGAAIPIARKRGSPRKIVPLYAASFFERCSPGETSGASVRNGNTSNMNATLNHKQAAAIIKKCNIPRSTIARIAGLHLSDLSSWLNGNLDFSQEKVERVSLAVADTAKMVEVMGRVGIRPDLADIENVKRLIVAVNDAEAGLNLFCDPPLNDLRTREAAAD